MIRFFTFVVNITCFLLNLTLLWFRVQHFQFYIYISSLNHLLDSARKYFRMVYGSEFMKRTKKNYWYLLRWIRVIKLNIKLLIESDRVRSETVFLFSCFPAIVRVIRSLFLFFYFLLFLIFRLASEWGSSNAISHWKWFRRPMVRNKGKIRRNNNNRYDWLLFRIFFYVTRVSVVWVSECIF